MRQAFNYYCLVIIGLMTISAFVLAQTLAQIVSATIFFALFIFFVDLVVTTRKAKKKAPALLSSPAKPTLLQLFFRDKPAALVPAASDLTTRQQQAKLEETGNSTQSSAEQLFAEDGEVLPDGVDVNRRLLLKTIASAGIGLFLMTLFTNKANAAFFGSVPGPGTVALKDSNDNVIDPAIKTPTDGYKVSEVDDAGSPAYYGFVDKTGAWFIMKEESSGAYRYTKGNSSFSSSWTNRASLTYGYFDSIF